MDIDCQNIKAAFGEKLRSIRTSKNLSQEKLAELADLDRTYIFSKFKPACQSGRLLALIKLNYMGKSKIKKIKIPIKLIGDKAPPLIKIIIPEITVI